MTLDHTHFSHLGQKKTGKVRDIYVQPDRLILIATDRHSAFDQAVAPIPYKGQILTQLSTFWFQKTQDIVPNHLMQTPDPNVQVVRKCTPFPLEVIVRGYLTGVTNTSIYTLYQKGQRAFGDLVLPEHMPKNAPLPVPIITPTTKSKGHDSPVSADQVPDLKIVTLKEWQTITRMALALFKRGQAIAQKAGLILVDTKYEFGKDDTGCIMLIDELHTPDSSRYWALKDYTKKIAQAKEPDYFDKEFLRLWIKKHADPYQDKRLPPIPQAIVAELSQRYQKVFEHLTGQAFVPEKSNPLARIAQNLN